MYNIYNFALKNRVKIVQKFKNTQNMKLQFFLHAIEGTYSRILNQSKHSSEN